MVEYRTFRNSDPPRLLALWLTSGLGRGAAEPTSILAFELGIFGLPYFDPQGLFIAESEGKIVGFAHGGFGFREDSQGCDREHGVICNLVVHPQYRRQGIGSELVRQAEAYLLRHGVKSIQFGQSKFRDPYYFGIHGGARPSGILDSDPGMTPFLERRGYVRTSGSIVLQRDLSTSRDPTNFRLINLRRQTELLAADPPPLTYKWGCHYGNIESRRFRLAIRKTSQTVAVVTIVGLDHYVKKWRERGIGLVEMQVAENFRGQGYGTTLLIESLKSMRKEMNVTLAELHIPEGHSMAAKAVQNAGFVAIERASVYTRPSN